MLFFKQFKNQQGAALLMVLVAVSLFGLMAGIAGSSWKTIVQRSREADLLFKGNQIREAIGTYYTVFLMQGILENNILSSWKIFFATLVH